MVLPKWLCRRRDVPHESSQIKPVWFAKQENTDRSRLLWFARRGAHIQTFDSLYEQDAVLMVVWYDTLGHEHQIFGLGSTSEEMLIDAIDKAIPIGEMVSYDTH